MPLNTRTIRRRIRSVNNTKKITKAMEMVAASKMRKSVEAVLATRAYANLAWETVNRLKNHANPKLHRLLQTREVKRIGVVVMSSNRGLCGGFNSNLLRECLRLRGEAPHEALVFITLGKKVRDGLRRRGGTIEADFEKQDVTRRVEDIIGVGRLAVDGFVNGEYDKVLLVYTDFKSAMSQKVTVKQLLPIQKLAEDAETRRTEFNIIFEPSPQYVLQTMLPRLIEMQIYQAVLESEASEHSARMVAMRSASDAAGEMIDELTLLFNRARQASITQEISEIVGGKAALD